MPEEEGLFETSLDYNDLELRAARMKGTGKHSSGILEFTWDLSLRGPTSRGVAAGQTDSSSMP